MKIKSLLFLALTALLTLAAPRPARAEIEVSFDFFYDTLSPYGEWLEVGDYGYCWRPTGVDEDWSPYSDGYWSYTDAGWTWVSYEEYGGVVYHYGRWVKVEDEGWCWVPDYDWGPAWVSWRNNDDYVGWAPLPPEARFEREVGFTAWVDTRYDIGPSNYNFCHTRDFGAPVLRGVLVDRRENVVIIDRTVNITNISYDRDRDWVFNRGPSYVTVNRYSQRRVPTLKLVRNTNVTVVNNTIINNNVRVTNINSVQQGNQLTVIAPRVNRPQAGRLNELLRPKVTKVVAREKVNKGWATISPQDRQRITARQREEATQQVPETAVAVPVKVADLEAVPKKADPTAVLPGGPRPARPGRPGQQRQPGNAASPAAVAPGTDKIAADEPAPVATPANAARPKAPIKAKPGQARPPVAVPAPGVDAPVAAEPATEVPPARVKPVPGRPPVVARPPAVPKPNAPADVEGLPPTESPERNVPREKPGNVPARPGVTKPFNARPGVGPSEAPAATDSAAPENDPATRRNALRAPAEARPPVQPNAPVPAESRPVPPVQPPGNPDGPRRRQPDGAQQSSEARERQAQNAQQQAETRQRTQEAAAQRQEAAASQRQATQERAQQLAETRRNQLQERSAQSAQQQLAARQRAAEQGQEQTAARQQAQEVQRAQRQQAVAPPSQPPVRARAPQPQNLAVRPRGPSPEAAPPAQNRVAPAAGGAPGKAKGKLTPEEAAALKKQEN